MSHLNHATINLKYEIDSLGYPLDVVTPNQKIPWDPHHVYPMKTWVKFEYFILSNSNASLCIYCFASGADSHYHQYYYYMPEWPSQVRFWSHVSITRQEEHVVPFLCPLLRPSDVKSFYQNLYSMAFMDWILSKAKWQQQATAILWVFSWE